jgi:DNA-binding NarL/FixJ family response regulator
MEKETVSSGERVRILIADDQANVRKGLQVVLQLEDGLEVVGTAANGLEAVELAERLSPDVILMDLSMPYLDGFEAMRRIRDKKLPTLVIALTTHSDPVSQEAAERAGAVALIEKGAPDSGLVQIIRSVCRTRPSTGQSQRF